MEKLKGLTEKEVTKRSRKYGPNELVELLKISPLKILLRQIKNNFIVYLLVIAVFLSFFVGKSITAFTILLVIIIIVGVGFFQEYRAEKAISALKKMIMPISIVVREGKEIEIPSREIVPGDILILRTGEKIPADCLVLEAKELRVNEAILTGESQEIKKIGTKSGRNYKRESQLFMGTLIVNGRCVARVLHIGMNTEFGKIAGMISAAEKELPLQKKVNNLTKYMVIVALTVSILTGIVMLIQSTSISSELIIDILMVVIALSVSAFPEGFPVVLMTTLATGAYRMAQKNAIVNRMSIIETLGETTVICSDKTGTITSGEMTVKNIFCDNQLFEVSGAGYEATGDFLCNNKKIDIKKNNSLNLLLKAGVLCNDSKIERKGTNNEYLMRGTPTEAALLIASAKAGIFRDDLNFLRGEEIPFNSERKIMSVAIKEKDGNYVYSKGALEVLLKNCKYIQREQGIFTLLEKDKKQIITMNLKLTSKSFRTIAIAYKKIKQINKDHFEQELVFLGLVGMEDPPREEVKEAIKMCYAAGINIKMITGDSKETAIAIANQINLKRGEIFDGEELDKMSDKELFRIVKSAVIFSRVKPEHKLRIVRALKEHGEIVTMTGDGVNDAPALKESHIGVAMGIGGTDVTREVADLTLKDNNFATIVYAIKEGRTIFNNIQKFVTYQLSCNYAELLVIFLGILLGLPLPLLALQILFMNLVTDNLPAITLGFNPSSQDVMNKKPRKKSHILDRQLILLILTGGATMGIITLGVFYLVLNILNQGLIVARTTALLTLILFEIAHAFNFRSFRKGVLNRSPLVNKPLVYASIISLFATALIIYTPLNKAFETTPIGPMNILVAFVASLIIVLIFDIMKVKRGDLSINKETKKS
ncbi:MAG: cation-transporting P-type ATPase [archaeon]|nr:cation-transporting P-type ATPase [archaeon]MCR4323464.1 cation-transporting P-type ATPase [Nanoarchaeota archaeon]